MKILRLTIADAQEKNGPVWVNFDLVERVESRRDCDGKDLGGARIYFANDSMVLTKESAEDIMMALSVMDNKPYNVGISYYVGKGAGGSQ